MPPIPPHRGHCDGVLVLALYLPSEWYYQRQRVAEYLQWFGICERVSLRIPTKPPQYGLVSKCVRILRTVSSCLAGYVDSAHMLHQVLLSNIWKTRIWGCSYVGRTSVVGAQRGYISRRIRIKSIKLWDLPIWCAVPTTHDSGRITASEAGCVRIKVRCVRKFRR
ncbi:hypothetical protein EV401DRAFT_1388279 [Pisolithus croceorrhizus]|nr:hypothetical protein EV401DRAFT_1388279 [Pisolithus croceorrhizus]